MSIIQTRQARITTGTTDNDTFATKGYVDDNIGPAGSGIKTQDLTAQLGAGGVTVFTLNSTPVDPEKSILFYNGQQQFYGINYTISGTTLTWITTSPSFALGPNDGINGFWIYYDITSAPTPPPPSEPLFVVRTTAQAPGATGDGNVAQIPMTGVDVNVGGMYDPVTSIFTPTVPGAVYEFMLTVHLIGIEPQHDSMYFALRHSGPPEKIYYLFYANPNNIWVGAGNEAIVSGGSAVSMIATSTLDFVVCVAGSTRTIAIGTETYATGKLLYQTIS